MRSDDVLATVAQVRKLSDDVRALADRTAASGDVRWRSTAAEAFRRRLAEEVARVRSTAAALDEGAAALRRHALALDEPHGWFGWRGDL